MLILNLCDFEDFCPNSLSPVSHKEGIWATSANGERGDKIKQLYLCLGGNKTVFFL